MYNKDRTSPSLDESPRALNRPYDTPRLTVHGTVEDVTQGTGTGAVDGFPSGSVIP